MAMAMAMGREDRVYMAKLDEGAERFKEMAEHMEEVVKAVGASALTTEERNLLAVAWKHTIRVGRKSLLVFRWAEEKEERAGNQGRAAMITVYRLKIEVKLSEACRRILEFLEAHLIPSASSTESSASSPESEVFFKKMRGDYYRYLADVKRGGDRTAASKESNDAYEAAQADALKKLPPKHPTRLGVALNFSIFKYEVMHSKEDARKLATEALDAATDVSGDAPYKDGSTYLMQLIRDNLRLWSSDKEDGEVGGR